MFKREYQIIKWDVRFMELAHFYARWSKDPSTKVGAVIVDTDRNPIGQGYNGFPRDVSDLPERLNNRETKHAFTMHAEANAVLRALATGKDLSRAIIYCTHFPCVDCAKLIVQSGLRHVYCPMTADLEGWEKSQERARIIFVETNTMVCQI